MCGVNAVVANVHGSNPGEGVGVFACATSGRTLHVCTGAGQTLLRVRDVHGDKSDCSIYAIAWGGDANNSLIATGGNDGSVGVTQLKWSDDDLADSSRLVAVNGAKAKVNARAHRGGAVRGVAFLNPTLIVSGGGGDYSPRVWDLGQDLGGASMPETCTRELRAHGSEIVGVCADWGSFAGLSGSTENFAATASADGEVRVWDLRERTGAPPTLRLNARGAAGGARDTRLSALSVRGERVAVGYTDGGVAVLDLRCASSSDNIGNSYGHSSFDAHDDSDSAVVWSDRFHEGECRSVDLDPSGKLLLTAGFDGVCVVVNAADGINANVAEYANDTHTRADRDAHANDPARKGGVLVDGGRGCYCGHVDKVVSARWRPGTSDGAVGFASCGVDRTVRYWHAAAAARR